MTKLNKIFLAVCMVLSSSGLLKASTTVPAIISSNQVWTAAGSPYIVNQNVVINNGSSVRVMPGVTIQGTGFFTIVVEGEFNASGTQDSVIFIDSLKIDFKSNAVPYDFTSSGGSQFNYCYWESDLSGGRISINVDKINLFIGNCRFINHYYTIYGINASTTAAKVKVVKSRFESTQKFNYGYPVYAMGSKSELEMDECEVINQYCLFPAVSTKITRSTFNTNQSWGGFRIGHTMIKAIFRCNTFKNYKNSVFELMPTNAATIIDICNNTFDTANIFIEYRVSGSLGQINKPKIKNNNFLYSKSYAISMAGGNSPGLADTIILEDNYWNTTDTAQIAARIHDFKDDVLVAVMGEVDGILTSALYDCSEDLVSVKRVVASSFELYPNPASDRSVLSFEKEAARTIKVYDMKGGIVLQQSTEGSELVIDLSGFNNGMFIVEVSESNHALTRTKLMVQR